MTVIAAFMKPRIYIISLTIVMAILVVGIGMGLGATPKVAMQAAGIAPKSAQLMTRVDSPALRNIMELGTSGAADDSGQQSFGDMGGEEMVEREQPFIGDMGGEEMVERQETTADGASDSGTGEGTLPADGGDSGIWEWQEGTSQGQPETAYTLEPSPTVYVGTSTIPLATLQSTSGLFLRIKSDEVLLQYASIPQYTILQLMAYTSTGGPGEILEMFPSDSGQGIYQRTNYNFNPGNNPIPYRGDVAGRHYLMFTLNDQSSNGIIIDVENAPILGTTPNASE